MYKNLISRSLFISCLIVIGGCYPYSTQQQINTLQNELDTLKTGSSDLVVDAEEAEIKRLEAELAAAKAKVGTTTNTVVNNPAPAPVIVAPATPKFGPGNGNHMNGSVEGYLNIHTNSANGKLTLRVNPDQNAQGLVEIPNGTSGLYYYNKVQVGEYVWYYTTYGSYSGYLRGDYVDAF